MLRNFFFVILEFILTNILEFQVLESLINFLQENSTFQYVFEFLINK